MPKPKPLQLKSISTFLASSTQTLLVLAVIIYTGYVLGRSVWQNWQINQEIDIYKQEIISLRSDINYLKNQTEYMQTRSFVELEARRRLNWTAPGEKSVVLAQNTDPKNNEPQDQGVKKKSEDTRPNWVRWYEFIFFHKKSPQI